MKASDLIKKSLKATDIFTEISKTIENNPNHYKHFIPHFIYISNDEQVELSKMGFKVTHGEWFRGDFGLIIEW